LRSVTATLVPAAGYRGLRQPVTEGRAWFHEGLASTISKDSENNDNLKNEPVRHRTGL